ncbi:hypothetical protein GCM10023170_082100 [Phytohabitans houttuyneae]|uniref:Uncharacterized protein n=1 Tax=Phytohabitans houttuyneae TaxID=1076126 RepID=A0A6V8KEX6_9ACTN|nr:hypothetical protein Phou_061900 [Phytohabitans houttuyneae]
MVDRLAVVAELGGDPRDAVGAVERVMHGPDPGRQSRVSGSTSRSGRRGGLPVIEAGPSDPKDLTQPLHAIALPVVVDELEAGQDASIN